MKDILLKINKLSKSMEFHVPHVSIFIPIDGDEQKVFLHQYNQCNVLLKKDQKKRISHLKINWKKYKKKGFKSVAIFMTHKGHIQLGLPFMIGPKFIIGDSFHVKPLLLIEDYQKHSILLHFNTQGANLYLLSSRGFKLIDTYLPPQNQFDPLWPEIISGPKLRNYLRFVKGEVRTNIKADITSFLISGLDQKRFMVKEFWKFEGIKTTFIEDEYFSPTPIDSIDYGKMELKNLIDSEYEEHINQFLECHLENDLTFDFFKLGSLIQNEKINKLYVSLEDLYFGYICKKTGNTNINITQKDTSDEDLLNIFIMLCLEKNIDVKVIPKRFFPAGVSFVYH